MRLAHATAWIHVDARGRRMIEAALGVPGAPPAPSRAPSPLATLQALAALRPGARQP